MTVPPAEDARRARKLDRLYWESDRSVNDIAEDLGISKGRLYDLLESRAAGVACPACGAATVYENRTARERGEVTCPRCGASASLSDVAGEGGAASAGGKEGVRDRIGAPPGEAADGLPLPGRTVAAAALLGIAAGALVIALFRRR